jgi:hypothetical protein
MQRTAWRGFGNGDAGGGAFLSPMPDFTFAPGGSGDIQQLVNAAAARDAGYVNVDPLTALQSKISGAVPAGARLPLILAGVGLLALILTPSGGRGRR